MGFDPSTVVTDYGDPIGEARACRTATALFDFSFMSRAKIEGAGAIAALSRLTPRRLADLPVGRLRYAMRETADGYLASDLTIWRIGPDHWEVMSGRAVDIADLARFACEVGHARVDDLTSATRIFAVQGPETLDLLRAMVRPDEVGSLLALPYYGTVDLVLAGTHVRVGRLGYTGEQGVELLVPERHAEAIWTKLVAGSRQAGFIAADMLRIEAGFVLFANDFLLPVTAREAGLGQFCAADTGRPNKDELELVCFRAASHGDVSMFRPDRHLCRYAEPDVLAVTSACYSLAAGSVLGLGYAWRFRPRAMPLRDPTGMFSRIEVVSRPFYDPTKTRPRMPWC